MLTVHHLGKSQSERIVWLCEELGIAYDLRRYDRDPQTMRAPPEYKALHPLGAAPVITDGDVVMAESGAIMEYIIGRHGGGRFSVGEAAPNFPDYLFWFHYVNGSYQPGLARTSILNRVGVAADTPLMQAMTSQRTQSIGLVDARLSQVPYLAGDELTAADMMMVFSLTTMRHFTPYDIGSYRSILDYLQRVSARPGYRRAMEKGDPGMALLLT